MAPVALALKPSSDHFSLSRFISHFRSKRKSKQRGLDERISQQIDPRPPLKPSPLPLVLPENQDSLSQLGWTIVTFPQPVHDTAGSLNHQIQDTPGPHPLRQASQDLFKASAQFFDLPDDAKEKWKTRLGSEEGWSKIPGEKEFITMRTLAYTPEVLKGPAKRYWDLMGAYLDSSLGRISSSLGLEDSEDEALRKFVGPCKRMGEREEDKTATMLRLFRYEGWEEKTVAEAHADLGLLSCVVGDVPGLEVWDGGDFIPIEKTFTTPCATLLGGRQLERLSNYRYAAGGHRVVAYGRPDAVETSDQTPHYRFSIVFVLRAHEPVAVDRGLLTTDITGPWQQPLNGSTAGDLYAEIHHSHFNINAGIQQREKQRRRLEEREMKAYEAATASG